MKIEFLFRFNLNSFEKFILIKNDLKRGINEIE